MTFQVEAWLDLQDPMLRIIDAETEGLHLGPKQIHGLIGSGDICRSVRKRDFASYAALIALADEQAA